MSLKNLRSLFYVSVLAVLSSYGLFADTYEGPIFDAHVHYNVEALDRFPPEAVLNKFQENKVEAFLSNSRTNDGTHRLAKALSESKTSSTRIVPFIRLYRNRDDYTNWFRDPTIYSMVESELERGTDQGNFKGIGEFHLYESSNAHGETAVKLMKLSVKENLVILAHVDDEAIENLMSYAPEARIIWAHTGISGVPVDRVEALLKKYPRLMGELSYRPGLTGSDGLLTPAWRGLIQSRPERFLVGSDTWVNSRWDSYSDIMNSYRVWLGGLPPKTARMVAWENGLRLFQMQE